jgi:hypothetical protein
MKVLVNRDVTIPILPILYGIGIGSIGIVTSLFTSTFIVYPVNWDWWIPKKTPIKCHISHQIC